MSIIQTNNNYCCKFCEKPCKNLNSLRQHETRCPSNPNRKDWDKLIKLNSSRKGCTKLNNETVAKCAKSLKAKYASGYSSPLKGTKHIVNHIYKEHNDQEISRWYDYINTSNIVIPNYIAIPFGKKRSYYNIIQGQYTKRGNTIKPCFEHDFIAQHYINCYSNDNYVVHHIDKNGHNNDIHNLMIFASTRDHMRYHNCTDAWLCYDAQSHIFTCTKQ